VAPEEAHGELRSAAGRIDSHDDRWTYAMATPDALLAGALPMILKQLSACDLSPVACRILALSIEQMQLFYGTSEFLIHDPGQLDYKFPWGMHRELYALAPACIIMLRHDQGSACERMMVCKGATRPEIAEPGTVRSMGENVIFNLIHCPDDADSARDELSILLGDEADWLLSMIDRPFALDGSMSRLLGAEAMLECVPSFSGPEAVSFVFIANRVRGRLAQWLGLALREDAAAVRQLSRVMCELTLERQRLRSLSGSTDRLRAARSASSALHELLSGAARSLGEPRVSAGIDALSALYDLRGIRDPGAIFALARYGIYLAPLERVIIESHCHAFRPNNEINGIYL
jgi:nucleoside diphosphate kinase